MKQLTFTEFLITIAILLVLAFGASQLLQSWLLNIQAETTGRIQGSQVYR